MIENFHGDRVYRDLAAPGQAVQYLSEAMDAGMEFLRAYVDELISGDKVPENVKRTK